MARTVLTKYLSPTDTLSVALSGCGPVSSNAERITVYVDHHMEACSNLSGGSHGLCGQVSSDKEETLGHIGRFPSEYVSFLPNSFVHEAPLASRWGWAIVEGDNTHIPII